jgi:hypothetical protein
MGGALSSVATADEGRPCLIGKNSFGSALRG